MRQLEIKKGEHESASYALGPMSISAIYIPQYGPATLSFWGSHDNDKYGPIYKEDKPLEILLNQKYKVHIIDPDDFDGIQYFKLVLSENAHYDLKFPIHFKDS